MTLRPRPQNDAELRGEAEFRRFHAHGVNEPTLDYLRMCLTERRDLFRDLALRESRLSPFVEIGAETGVNSLLLTGDLGAAGLALDISRDALAVMPQYAERLHVAALPWRVWGDAYSLPLRNDSLALAVCWGALHHLADPRPALAELRRVLAPGGLLLVGDEPVRRRLSLRLGRTRDYRALGGAARWLVRAHLLPWLMSIGGREAVAAGAAEWQFSRRAYKIWLTEAFEQVDLQDYPYTTATIRSAGPAARGLLSLLGPTWAPKAEVAWFGGAIGARCRKAPEPLIAAPAAGPAGRRTYLLRKQPGHDRLRVIGPFTSTPVLRIDGETVIPDGDGQLILPPASHRRGAVKLETDGPPLEHFVFTGGEANRPLWLPPPRSTAPVESVEAALACPACWTVNERCRPDLCGRPCTAAAPAGVMRPAGGRMVVETGREPGWRAVRACPAGAIERPALQPPSDADGSPVYRCPQCGTDYSTEDGIVDLRSPRARRVLG